MVCERCLKKQADHRLIPDPWKNGGKRSDQKRRINPNMLLVNKRKNRAKSSACRICKAILGTDAAYCNTCAYQKGICAMCGRKVQQHE